MTKLSVTQAAEDQIFGRHLMKFAKSFSRGKTWSNVRHHPTISQSGEAEKSRQEVETWIGPNRLKVRLKHDDVLQWRRKNCVA